HLRGRGGDRHVAGVIVLSTIPLRPRLQVGLAFLRGGLQLRRHAVLCGIERTREGGRCGERKSNDGTDCGSQRSHHRHGLLLLERRNVRANGSTAQGTVALYDGTSQEIVWEERVLTDGRNVGATVSTCAADAIRC